VSALGLALGTWTTMQIGPLYVNALERRVELNGAPIPLTPNEWTILIALVERPNEIVSRSELIRRMWPGWTHEFDPHTRAVDSNVYRLRRKLGHGLIIGVKDVGYRLVQLPQADDEA
jgi:DNA-binding response OmpR family regulator